MGEHVEGLYKGSFHRCAMASPARLYGKHWHNASAAQKRLWMQPLAAPSSWCVRSLDPAPGFAQRLQGAHDAGLSPRSASALGPGGSLRYVDAALGTVTGPAVPRTIVRYSNDTWGLTATTFSHRDIHAGRPPLLATWNTSGASLDIRDVLRRYGSATTHIALKLDVEGMEFAVLDALADEPQLLCSVSYLFVEYHNLKFNLTKYGFRADAYSHIGGRIRQAMDSVPNCKLRIHWRSFWSACGESMRFVWAGKTQQATGRNMSDQASAGKAKSNRARAPRKAATARRGRMLRFQRRPLHGVAAVEQ